MTNQQLYLAIGLPMLTTIVGFLLQSQSFNARFDGLQKQIDQITQRLTAIEAAMRGLYETSGRHDEAINTLKQSRAS